MNQKDFIKMLRLLIRSEIRPIIEEVVTDVMAHEFRMLKEELTVPQQPTHTRQFLAEEDDDIQLSALFDDEPQTSMRTVTQQPKKQLFKESKGNVFTDMLQQTLDEGYRPGQIQSQVAPAQDGQQLVQLNNATPAQTPNRSSLVEALGYGDMGSGVSMDVPGAKQPVQRPQPNVVQVPATNPEGKPIDASKIPDFLLKAMNKDYSKTLKDSEKATAMRRGLPVKE